MPFIGLWCYKTASYFFGRIQLYQDKSDKRVGIFNLITVFLNTNSWYTCTIYEIRTLWGNQINKQHILLIVKIIWDPYSECCVIFTHSLHVVFLKTMYILSKTDDRLSNLLSENLHHIKLWKCLWFLVKKNHSGVNGIRSSGTCTLYLHQLKFCLVYFSQLFWLDCL